MKKITLWVIGIIIILMGVGTVQLGPSFKGEENLIVNFVGYSLAFIGIFLIIYAVNKNNSDNSSEENEDNQENE